MATVLLEIGTEELPASYVPPALVQMADLARARLRDERIAVEDIHTWATPRRLALYLTGVAPQQMPAVREVRGPAVTAAFAANSEPTQAAMGFARSQGIAISDLRIKQIDNGEFVIAVFHDEGRPTPEILPSLFARIVADLSFPRTMRWGAGAFRFARPIRWIVALMDDAVLPLTIGNVTADRLTRGHRFLAPGEVAIPNAASYHRLLDENHVLVVPNERRDAIRHQLDAIAEQTGATIVDDGSLLDETTFHLEYPTAVQCNIDERFLSLPEEVLIHVLRYEQSFFPLRDTQGALLPAFLAVRNGDKAYLGGVREGYESVARAKLLDALFFFEQDNRRALGDRVEDLRGVIFQERLGTLHDKAMRVQALAGRIADWLDLSVQEKTLAERSALLCKADLVTAMVTEHPALRGIMGRVYAQSAGEPAVVATAIGESYQPVGAHEPLPATELGRVVALADKTDTVVACFAVGLIPTGSEDPYALRREAMGLVRILAEGRLRVALSQLLAGALALLPGDSAQPAEETLAALTSFCRQRLETVLAACALPSGVARAVLAVSADMPADALRRGQVIMERFGNPAFAAVIRTATRLTNISRNVPELPVATTVLTAPIEREIIARCQEITPRAEFFAARAEFEELPALLEDLTPLVERFFAEVLVMADDPELRQARLALVRRLAALYRLLGDLSQVEDATK